MIDFVTNFVITLYSTITAPSAKLKIDLLFKSNITCKNVPPPLFPQPSFHLEVINDKCMVPKLLDNWFAAGTQNCNTGYQVLF